MAVRAHLDVPQEPPNALPAHPGEFGPELPVVQGRLFAVLQTAHQMDARPQLDGLPAALFVAEACPAAAVLPAAPPVPQVELLPAGLASVRQEQHPARMQLDEQHLLVAQSQGGVAVSVQALPAAPEAWLPQAELATKARVAQDAPQALQQAAARLAWPLLRQRPSVFQLRPELQHLPEHGNAFLLFRPGRDPTNSSASSFP